MYMCVYLCVSRVGSLSLQYTLIYTNLLDGMCEYLFCMCSVSHLYKSNYKHT